MHPWLVTPLSMSFLFCTVIHPSKLAVLLSPYVTHSQLPLGRTHLFLGCRNWLCIGHLWCHSGSPPTLLHALPTPPLRSRKDVQHLRRHIPLRLPATPPAQHHRSQGRGHGRRRRRCRLTYQPRAHMPQQRPRKGLLLVRPLLPRASVHTDINTSYNSAPSKSSSTPCARASSAPKSPHPGTPSAS